MRNFNLTLTEYGWQLKEEGDKYAYKIFKTDKETAVRESAEELKKFKTTFPFFDSVTNPLP